MKKITSLLLVITLIASLFALSSCSKDGEDENVTIKIGVMNGPTGMGMAKLMADNTDGKKYEFRAFSSPNDATAAIANGELDMLCLPTNLAANLAAKQNNFITVLSINCLGSLYVVTDGTVSVNSIKDLEGKTVYYGEPTSTTPAILNFLLEQNDIKDKVTLEALATNELVGEKIIKGEVSIAVLPEPKATATLAQAANNQNNTKNYSISLNISEEWDKVSDSPLTMGCIIVSNKFLKEHKSAVDAFLGEYKASIEYIGNKSNLDSAAKMIADAKILPSEPVAKKALNNLYGSIVYIDGADMKNALLEFYAAINLRVNPGDNFYYEK